MSSLVNTTKTREEILAERQEKKKKKAALKNQPKEKAPNTGKDVFDKGSSKVSESASDKDVKVSVDVKTGKQSASENALQKQSKVKNCNDQSDKKTVKASSETEKSRKGSGSDIKNEEKQNVDCKKTEVKESDKKTENEVKSDGSNVEGATKTKAQLKAERRAKQEAERARKLEKTETSVKEKKVSKPPVKPTEPVKVMRSSPAPSEISHKVKLFAHLYSIVPEIDTVDSPVKIHPSIIQLKTQYASKVVAGPNASCLALLNAFKKVVMDFETPPDKDFSRGLEAEITKSMAYLSKGRPVEVSMLNAVKHLKFQVTQSKGNELECKNIISEWIDTYIREQLEMAAQAICLFVREKIAPGDVILTYGCCSLIQQILISVHNEGINFQVIVVDGRPGLEGREMLKKLVAAGIRCTYVFVNGLSFIMPEVTKILLGAHALLANGYVMSRAGSSQIALLAKTYNVPVLVCCETHKFSEKVQTDSFVYNELGNPDDLASRKGCLSKELSKWKSIQYLTPLNLTYDVTPPDLVSAVVTEVAVLPCTSVPVILRIKPPDVSC